MSAVHNGPQYFLFPLAMLIESSYGPTELIHRIRLRRLTSPSAWDLHANYFCKNAAMQQHIEKHGNAYSPPVPCDGKQQEGLGQDTETQMCHLHQRCNTCWSLSSLPPYQPAAHTTYGYESPVLKLCIQVF